MTPLFSFSVILFILFVLCAENTGRMRGCPTPSHCVRVLREGRTATAAGWEPRPTGWHGWQTTPNGGQIHGSGWGHRWVQFQFKKRNNFLTEHNRNHALKISLLPRLSNWTVNPCLLFGKMFACSEGNVCSVDEASPQLVYLYLLTYFSGWPAL